MKRVFYIMTAALMAMVACTKEINWSPEVPQEDAETDAPKVLLTFSVPSEIRTRAMGAKPDVQTMHVAVFNAAGYLKEYEEANLTEKSKVNAGGEATDTYTVKLTMATTKRTLHFIANSPFASKDDFPTTTGEANVMNSLISSFSEDMNDAYWQCKVLEEGITAYTYPGGKLDTKYVNGPNPVAVEYLDDSGNVVTSDADIADSKRYRYIPSDSSTPVVISKGDYIQRDGSKVLDDSGYFASQKVSDEVASLAMIRNFARITVSSPSTWESGAISGTSNFVPVQFTILNTPSHGFVAPYDAKAGRFSEEYMGIKTASELTYDAVSASGYAGAMPTAASLMSDTEELPMIQLSGDDPYFYAYERPVPTSSTAPVMVLVQGHKKLDDESYALRWFKIELTAEDGSYIPVYRGCTYDMNIANIAGSDGYATMEEAVNNPPMGDISSSTETENLTSISKNGVTLTVEYIGKNHIGDATDVTLKYKMMNGSTNVTGNVALSIGEYSGVAAAVSKVVAGTSADADGWYTATVSLVATGDATANKKSDVIVSGTVKDGAKTTTLTRKVLYVVMPKQNFQGLQATGLVQDVKGDETTISFKLPADLPFSMFPLNIVIESNNNNLNPVDDLPVRYGPSAFDASKTSLYFLKTVNWSDYQESEAKTDETEHLWFCARFKTTRDGAVTGNDATTTKVAVADQGGYFNSLPTTLTKADFGVSPNTLTVKGSATSAQFDILTSSSISDVSWSISEPVTKAGELSVSPAKGTGAATVTMTFPANTTKAGEADAKSNTYEATVSYSYKDASGTLQRGEIVVKVTQVPLQNVTRTVEATNKEFTLSNASTFTITDSDDSSKKVTLGSLTNLSWSTSNSCFEANSNSSLVVTPTGVTITGLTLTWSGNNYRPSSGTVTPAGGTGSSLTVGNTTGTWTGSSDKALTVDMIKRRSYNTRISKISVSYTYEVTEWE